MGAAEEDLTEPSALEECCCGPMFPRESRGLSKPDNVNKQLCKSQPALRVKKQIFCWFPTVLEEET